MSRPLAFLTVAAVSALPLSLRAGTRATPLYAEMKAFLDGVPAIDTHDHLRPFEELSARVETHRGRGMNLYGIWNWSYYNWYNPLTTWKPGQTFETWWARARHDFDDARATGFYRYQLPAFTDLYGIDFERMTDRQAAELDRRIFENYRDPKWIYKVVTERANIELMLVDPPRANLAFETHYPFVGLVVNITRLVRGFHPSEFKEPLDDPYAFARQHGLKIETLEDYVALLDRILAEAKARKAACLKQVLAYQRTLEFANVPRDRAAAAFGRKREELTPAQIRDFEDYVMWRIVELCAKHDLPIQIHTGHARIQGSNPMLLVDLIEANPRTKLILFHGGYPWVGETGAIVTRHAGHVWIDSVWLPTISYTMAKRAFHEWLEVMPSSRLMWGGDCQHAEGIYAATELTRRCLAEVLAEKIDAGDLTKEQARQIGRQILRDNALELFPTLREKLWKHKGKLSPQKP